MLILIFGDGPLYRAFRMLRFIYSDGWLYRAYRVLRSRIVMEGYIGQIGLYRAL